MKKENTYIDVLEDERFIGVDSEEQIIIERCESLAPITLSTIKFFGKTRLIKIILTREIAYNDLLKQMNLDTKIHRVKNFVENKKDPFNWFQIQLAKSNRIIFRLERENNILKRRIETNERRIILV